MTQITTKDFDNEMKALACGVYKGNEDTIPKDWIKVSEFNNLKSGFHSEAFYKNGTIVISIRGTVNRSGFNPTETNAKNCQMLCKECNRRKSNK